jgi:ribosomal protein S10
MEVHKGRIEIHVQANQHALCEQVFKNIKASFAKAVDGNAVEITRVYMPNRRRDFAISAVVQGGGYHKQTYSIDRYKLLITVRTKEPATLPVIEQLIKTVYQTRMIAGVSIHVDNEYKLAQSRK